ncbi:cupin-like domain-containing protein [Rhizorhapis sp. SPR117]|uniref:cupin-like domain-containing protein n=1 Tax=Rhizorhapis sp. SPR117 TaxID=2912611 RepID=UPI001F1A8BD3|nr:cupin-like domain-containing protein [Rhizorhapis sp. SPR117]
MTIQADIIPQVFPDTTRALFEQAYPDAHVRLGHNLSGHALLTREALAALAERLPNDRVEYNRGDLPIGIRPEDTPANGLSVSDTIRSIDDNGSWMVLKNIERDHGYRSLLESALTEIAPLVEAQTGPMLHMEAFIFLSSPNSVTPFHMDPEHNILLQIEGEKTMTVFPPGDEALVPPRQSESFHGGSHRNLAWNDAFLAKGTKVHLTPGDALLVPVKAPHFVQNGPSVSISFSITWRSKRSVAEGELHSLNATLRRWSLPLVSIGKAPERQALARLFYRIMRKLGV